MELVLHHIVVGWQQRRLGRQGLAFQLCLDFLQGENLILTRDFLVLFVACLFVGPERCHRLQNIVDAGVCGSSVRDALSSRSRGRLQTALRLRVVAQGKIKVVLHVGERSSTEGLVVESVILFQVVEIQGFQVLIRLGLAAGRRRRVESKERHGLLQFGIRTVQLGVFERSSNVE